VGDGPGLPGGPRGGRAHYNLLHRVSLIFFVLHCMRRIRAIFFSSRQFCFTPRHYDACAPTAAFHSAQYRTSLRLASQRVGLGFLVTGAAYALVSAAFPVWFAAGLGWAMAVIVGFVRVLLVVLEFRARIPPPPPSYHTPHCTTPHHTQTPGRACRGCPPPVSESGAYPPTRPRLPPLRLPGCIHHHLHCFVSPHAHGRTGVERSPIHVHGHKAASPRKPRPQS
jgi:hypothetical protein